MKTIATDRRSYDGRTPTGIWLLRNPIDFIAEDHLRLRAMCAEMDRLADGGTFDATELTELRDYLTEELPALLADEDEDLMPLVLERAEPEDELPKLARRLDREHREIDGFLALASAAFQGHVPGTVVASQFQTVLRDLAQATRRHLILENAVLLPLARVRLTDADLIALRKAMLRRRGLQDPFAE